MLTEAMSNDSQQVGNSKEDSCKSLRGPVFTSLLAYLFLAMGFWSGVAYIGLAIFGDSSYELLGAVALFLLLSIILFLSAILTTLAKLAGYKTIL